MTRKDYELIAGAIRGGINTTPAEGLLDYHDDPHWQAYTMCAIRLADALKSTNPNFKRGVFLRACGLEETTP